MPAKCKCTPITRIADRTSRERDNDVACLAKKSEKELRRRQDLVNQQIGMAHEQRNTRALDNLRAMEADLIEALDRKYWGT